MTNEDKYLFYWIFKILEPGLDKVPIDEQDFKIVQAPDWAWPAFQERIAAYRRFDKIASENK